jgi:hypothetical protein
MDLNLSLHDKIPLGSSIVDSCVQNLILVFKRLQTRDKINQLQGYLFYFVSRFESLVLEKPEKKLGFWELILSFFTKYEVWSDCVSKKSSKYDYQINNWCHWNSMNQHKQLFWSKKINAKGFRVLLDKSHTQWTRRYKHQCLFFFRITKTKNFHFFFF